MRNQFFQQAYFVFHQRHYANCISWFRKIRYTLLGMKIGKGIALASVYVTWPHQVSIGANCILEHNTFFKFDGIWQQGPSIIIHNDVFIGNNCEFNISKGIEIGHHAMIASGCKFIDHDHGTAITSSMNRQKAVVAPIFIGEEVWMGVNCVVLKGVKIGRGAVVAAGSVVIRDIGEYEIVGGVPAKYIRKRG
jgi:acetyltransferase-like isoleucine patch superfamily enzyme